MFERFTDRARKVMALANQESQRFNHETIGPEHILLGMVKEPDCLGTKMLLACGIDPRKVRLEIEKLVKSGPDMVTIGKLPQTSRAKKAIDFAIAEARGLEHNYVGTEHILLGLLQVEDSIAGTVLQSLGLTVEKAKTSLAEMLSRVDAAAERGRTFAQWFTADIARMSQTISSVSVNVDLRDYFAGQALAGILLNAELTQPQTPFSFQKRAEAAYLAADAMLAARKSQPGEDVKP